MATITPQGIQGKTLTEYLDQREQEYRGIFGQDLDVGAETPQGQIIGIDAQALSAADDSIVVTHGQLYIYSAYGQQLDGHFALLGIGRKAATPTLVSVDLTGEPATLIPAGTKAKSVQGDVFELRDDVQLDGTGQAVGVMSAIETGPIAVGIGELTKIVDLVPGWETVNNLVAGTPGENQESDAEYTARYLRSLAINARTPLESVEAAVLDVDNVIDANIAENDTSSPVIIDGETFAPHSIGVAVQGGVDTDIATAIQRKKTLGTGTNGDTITPIPQLTGSGAEGPTIDIRFWRVTEIRTLVNLEISLRAGFPANGIVAIKEAVRDYFSGDFQTTEGQFEADGIRIGEDVRKTRLFMPINSIPGHDVLSLELLEFGGSDTDILTVNFNERAVIESLDDITVTVV